MYGIVLFCLLLAAVLERLLPYSADWNHDQHDTRTDALHFLVTTLVNAGAKTLAVLSAIWLSERFIPQNMLYKYLSAWPFALQIVLALALSGFLPYWIHRLSHEQDGWLWRIHSVHHSPGRLYWLNSTRFHPLNVVWNTFLGLFPLYLAGFSEPVLLMTGFMNNLVAVYNHTNIDFRLGWLNRVFNMNELHRWHHARDLATANHNYSGGALILWDLVFGTWYLPARTMAAQEVGLSDAQNYPQRSFALQMCYPWCQRGPDKRKIKAL